MNPLSFSRPSACRRGAVAALALSFVAVVFARGVRAQTAQPVDASTLRESLDELNRFRDWAAEELARLEREVSVGAEPAAIEAVEEARRQAVLFEEARVKYEWLVHSLETAERSLQRASETDNPALSQVLTKKARLNLDTAENLVTLLRSRSTPATGAYQVDEPPLPKVPPGPATPADRYPPSIFQQVERENAWPDDVLDKFDYQTILGGVQEEFDRTGGRAGAGGVALHKPAVLVGQLDLKQARRVVWRQGRLTLLYGDQQIQFPPLDREYTALAVRCVYGDEGEVAGRLVAVEEKAVVLATGPEQFGEVVWNREFLPAVWTPVPPGSPLELAFGPGIGLLSAPKPSTSRASYYGPIRGTRLGKVLFEADALLFSLFFGVDREGRPWSGPPLPGFVTDTEGWVYWLRSTQPEDRPARPVDSDGAPWWRGSGWYVWVPDRFSFRLAEDKRSFEFVETKMKLEYWSVGGWEAARQLSAEFALQVSERHQELAQKYPPLADLTEAAKAVSLARWLKQSGVPADLEWARSVELEPVDTPAEIHTPSVVWRTDTTGKPWIQKQEGNP